MAWLILLAGGLMEIVWAIGLKYCYVDETLHPVPIVITGLAMLASVVLLGWAMQSIPVGTAYGVWTGIGAVGTATLGIILFNDPATVARLLCLCLIVAGIIGLKLAS